MVRQKGGQPGNQNAVTHGRYSRSRRAERAAALEARPDSERAWLRDNPAPKTDYAAICDAIKAHRPNKPRADRVRVL